MIDVAALVGDLRVRLRARGVGREHEAVAAIGERVEQHLEGVLLAPGEVLADLVDDDARWIGVAAARADVEIVVVEEHADLGGFGGRLAFERIGLDEVDGGWGAGPRLVPQIAIELDAAREAHRRHLLAAARRGDRHRLRECCRTRKNHTKHIHDTSGPP